MSRQSQHFSFGRWGTLIRPVLALAVLCNPALQAGTVATWTGANSSAYSDSGNWVEGAVPNGGYNLVIPSAGNNPVLNISASVDSINLSSATSNLTIGAAAVLGINTDATSGAGFINGAGTLNLAANSVAVLVLGGGSGTVTVSAGTAVALGNSANNWISAGVAGTTLQNDGVISGSGSVNTNYGYGVHVENTGSITALGSAGLLLATGGAGLINTGTIRAGDGVNTGTLTLQSDTFTNNGQAIVANNGSTVNLVNATLNGGTLTSDAGATVTLQSSTFNGTLLNGSGSVQASGSSGLGGGVTIASGTTVDVAAGGSLLYAGAGLVNDGALTLNSTPGSVSGLILAGGNGTVTVGSTGSITMTNSAANWISASATGMTLQNDGVISGSGSVNTNYGYGFALINDGTIHANASNGMSLYNNGLITNNGTFQVDAGSALAIASGSTFTNFSGTTLTGGTYVVGGIMEFTGANVVSNAASITLDGASSLMEDQTGQDALRNFADNLEAGSFVLRNGRDFTSSGAFANAGYVGVSSGVTFTAGGGSVYTQTGGTTRVDGTLTAASVAVNGGDLSGTGTVNGNVSVDNGGAVNPGNSPAHLPSTATIHNRLPACLTLNSPAASVSTCCIFPDWPASTVR